MNPFLNERLQELTSELAQKAVIAKNNWISSCFEKYAPGIVRLIDSGQLNVALEFAITQGFDLIEEFDGTTAFRRNGEILSVWKLRFE